MLRVVWIEALQPGPGLLVQLIVDQHAALGAPGRGSQGGEHLSQHGIVTIISPPNRECINEDNLVSDNVQMYFLLGT